MATYFAFAPPPNNTFSFQPTLDNDVANAVVWWNTDAQRWYISVNIQGRGSLFNIPLIGSEPKVQIQSITWDHGIVTVRTIQPHNFRVLSTVELTVADCVPVGYNGVFLAFVTDINEFTYSLASNPGPSEALGTISYDFNLGGGYLTSSTLVFRESTRTFEVTP